MTRGGDEENFQAKGKTVRKEERTQDSFSTGLVDLS